MKVRAATAKDEALRRIVAMLVALAVLAEQTGARCFPVRCLVLWIFRRAEAMARDFVAEATGTRPPALDETAEVRNGPADAIFLAWRLRVLAAALGALLRAPWRCRHGAARLDGALRDVAHRYGRPGPGGWTPKPNDTS